MIPRTIHQIWLGPRPVPWKWISTWVEAHPNWRHYLWDNDRLMTCLASPTSAKPLPSLPAGDAPPARGVFSRPARFWQNWGLIGAMRELNGKADLMRYEILARYGGVYIDADVECVKPLGDHFLEHEAFASWEHETARPGLVATTVLGGRPGAALFKKLVELAPTRNMMGLAWQSVGPQFLTDVIGQLGGEGPGVKIYPARTFLPEHYSGETVPGEGAVETYGRHHWGSTKKGVYE